jgi:hypothetical protein
VKKHGLLEGSQGLAGLPRTVIRFAEAGELDPLSSL